jgi:translation initiation factor eIF-2B subunit beta
MSALKQPIIEEIGLLVTEIQDVDSTIAEHAIEHIYAKEVILTYGMSQTVLEFLKQAAEFRTFEVIVAETAPSFEGQKMAQELGNHGIETTVITGPPPHCLSLVSCDARH